VTTRTTTPTATSWTGALPIEDQTGRMRGVLPWQSVALLGTLLFPGPEPLNGLEQTGSEFRVADGAVFDSKHHPDDRVSELGELTDAMFLAPDRFVLVDASLFQLVFASIVSDAVQAAGRRGDGPGEFRGSPRLVARVAAGEVAVWDGQHRRLSVARVVDGQAVVEDAAYDRSLFRSGGTRPVAVYANGALVIRENRSPSTNMFEAATRQRGVFRDTIAYWLAEPDGTRRSFTGAMGSEMFSSVSPRGLQATARSTSDVMFGALLRQTQVGQHFALAQTDLGVVRVFDRQGGVSAEVPMPVGARVTDDHIDAERNRRRARNDARVKDAERFGGEFARIVAGSSENLDDIPANEVAPPIDRVVGDLDGRLWLRLFHPDGEIEQWQVWDVSAQEMLFTLALPVGEQVLDAVGDRVLVRTKDEFGVDYLLVREMVEANGSKEGR